MIETGARFPQQEGGAERLSREATDQAVRINERRTIGRELHQGILQELTVAGFRLRAIQGSAPASAAAIADFASWLRERQADLRRYVTGLEQGLANETDLAAVAAEFMAHYRLRLSFDLQLQSSRVAPDSLGAIAAILRDITPILTGSLRAKSIEIALDRTNEPALRIVHDGERVADHPAELAAIQSSMSSNGASLRIEPTDGPEAWIVGLAS